MSENQQSSHICSYTYKDEKGIEHGCQFEGTNIVSRQG